MDLKNEYNLSSQGPIYSQFMEAFHQEIDGQQNAKEKFLNEILNLNNDLHHEHDILSTMIFTGPEDNQKLKLLQTTAKVLLGSEDYLIYHDCKSNPQNNPFLFGNYVEQEIETQEIGPQLNNLVEEKEEPKKMVFVPILSKTSIEQLRYHAKEKNSLHKLADKFPGLSLIYFDNIDYLDQEKRNEFVDFLFNHKEITLNNVPYTLDFSKSIVVFGFKTQEDPGIGFNPSSRKDMKGFIQKNLGEEILSNTDKIIEFEELESHDINKFIERLGNTLQGKILHLSEKRIHIDYAPELIEAFKKDHLVYIDKTTKNIERKREKHIENGVASFIKNNQKNIIGSDSNKVNHITISIDPKKNGALIGRENKEENNDTTL